MQDYGLVSVIMPTYNCGRFIAESMRSVQAQTYQNWEIVIVDDCSTDGTFEVVEPMMKEDKRIRYFSNPFNSGAALSRNAVFSDSEPDSWNMDPELLEKAIIDRKEKTGKYPKAIVPVALYGMPYDCDKIMAISEKYGIPVVEDAAEGCGSRWKGQVLGTFG